MGVGGGGGARNTGGYIAISSVIKQKANLKTDVLRKQSTPNF